MNSSLQNFLTELYAIDPALREHEAELVPLLEQLLKHDPAQSPDAEFVAALRAQLREHTASFDYAQDDKAHWWRTVLPALGGALAVLIILPVAYIAWNGMQSSPTPSRSLFTYNIEEKDANAFGSLSDMPGPMPSGGGGRGETGGGGLGLGGGSIPMAAPTPAGNAPTEMIVTEPAVGKMIAPYPFPQYRYVYEGDLKDLAATVDVYKRTTPSGSSIPLSALAERLNIGTLDLSTFAGMNMDTVSFGQKVPFGYQLTLNMAQPMVNINANWDQWPQSKCTTEDCFRRERLTLAQVPSDAQLLAIANDFASDHGIDLSHYGEPIVDNQWKTDYERMTDKDLAYVPDTIRVIYPMLIGDKPVYDQSGMEAGINVNVSIRHKKVYDVWGIMAHAYQKSAYAGVTDQAAIKKFISNLDGWQTASLAKETDVKIVKLTLGEPVLSLVSYERYDKTPTEELVIPSLIFPVKGGKSADDPFYRRNVVVPLSKEMLDAQNELTQVMPMDGTMIK